MTQKTLINLIVLLAFRWIKTQKISKNMPSIGIICKKEQTIWGKNNELSIWNLLLCFTTGWHIISYILKNVNIETIFTLSIVFYLEVKTQNSKNLWESRCLMSFVGSSISNCVFVGFTNVRHFLLRLHRYKKWPYQGETGRNFLILAQHTLHWCRRR